MKRIIIILASLILCASCTPSMSSIKKAVDFQMTEYPKSTLMDIYKTFYQDEFGPGHLISDFEQVMDDLNMESVQSWGVPHNNVMYEKTGAKGNYYRVSIFVSNIGLISDEELAYAFMDSAKEPTQKQMDRFCRTWKKVAKVAAEYDIPDYDRDLESLNKLLTYPGFDKAVHHSDAYNDAYHPHYRIVSKKIFKEFVYPCLKDALAR